MINYGNERLTPTIPLKINIPFFIPKFRWIQLFEFWILFSFCEANNSDFEF